MTSTREQQMEFCKICTNRKFDAQRGLLCGLSNEFANFDGTCVDFTVDENQKKRNLQFDIRTAGSDGASRSIDFKKNKKNGMIISVVGVILLLLCFIYLNGILPIFLSASVLAYGLRTYYRGQEQEKILEKNKEFEEKHLKDKSH